MVTLEVPLEQDALLEGLPVDELATRAHAWLRRSPELFADVIDDLRVQVLDDALRARWIAYWKQNPIAAWTGRNPRAWFRIDEGRFRIDLDIAPEQAASLYRLTRELVDYRLAQYRDRRRRDQPTDASFVCKILSNQRDPIVKLPRRDRAQIPEGETDVRLPDGAVWQFRFAREFCNVARPAGTSRNQLPDLLRGWFGPRAGQPGTVVPIAQLDRARPPGRSRATTEDGLRRDRAGAAVRSRGSPAALGSSRGPPVRLGRSAGRAGRAGSRAVHRRHPAAGRDRIRAREARRDALAAPRGRPSDRGPRHVVAAGRRPGNLAQGAARCHGGCPTARSTRPGRQPRCCSPDRSRSTGWIERGERRARIVGSAPGGGLRIDGGPDGFAERTVSLIDLARVIQAADDVASAGGLLDEARVNKLRYLDGTPKESTRWIDTGWAIAAWQAIDHGPDRTGR